jgi:RNA polymerase sigma-70 factor (ECF subfamily)
MTDAEFEAFVRRFEDMVFATAVRLLGNPAEAEDVAQTVFLKAFERFEHLADSPTAGGWLKTVATNLCLNHLTRYRNRWRFFGDLARSDGQDGGHVAEDSILDTLAVSAPIDLERAQNAERLERALAHLPAHQRVPLVLFHFEDHSVQQIAAALGVSTAKVKTDMHRGRLALRRQLVESHGLA